MSDDDPGYGLCVTCGEYKDPETKFREGDCTCLDCHEAGDVGINYDVNGDGEVVEYEKPQERRK